MKTIAHPQKTGGQFLDALSVILRLSLRRVFSGTPRNGRDPACRAYCGNRRSRFLRCRKCIPPRPPAFNGLPWRVATEETVPDREIPFPGPAVFGQLPEIFRNALHRAGVLHQAHAGRVPCFHLPGTVKYSVLREIRGGDRKGAGKEC